MRVSVVISQLDQALERLAWDADRQLEHLQRWRVGPDELALEFDDAFRVVLGLVAEKLLPESVGLLLQPVDDSLSAMTRGPAEEWKPEAVAHSPAWDRLRHTAQHSLDALRVLQLGSTTD